MNALMNPASIAPPAASYSLAVRSSAGSEFLHTSGIVGNRPDGSIANNVGDQAAEIWRSLLVILGEAGFAATDIVSYTTYVLPAQELATVMAARDAALQGHRSASTLIVVPTLARAEWLIEIAVIAAK